MKITDPGVIKNGEKDLIEMLKEDLDLDVVREIVQKKMTAAALSPKGGEIVVHNNQIAFKMDFDLCLSGSLMFDRQGNHIPEEDEDIGPGEKMEIGLPDYDLADDDITDILQESRDFWETKKDS